jgi:hypothetical protein
MSRQYECSKCGETHRLKGCPVEEELLLVNEQLDELVGAPRRDSIWAQRWRITEAGLLALDAAREKP